MTSCATAKVMPKRPHTIKALASKIKSEDMVISLMVEVCMQYAMYCAARLHVSCQNCCRSGAYSVLQQAAV